MGTTIKAENGDAIPLLLGLAIIGGGGFQLFKNLFKLLSSTSQAVLVIIVGVCFMYAGHLSAKTRGNTITPTGDTQSN